MAGSARLKPERRDAVFCAASLGAGALSAVMLLPVLGAMKGASGVSVLDGVRRYTFPAITRFYQLVLPGLNPAAVSRLILPTLLAVLAVFGALVLLVWRICRRSASPGPKQMLCLVAVIVLIELWHVLIDRYVLYAEYLTNGDRTWSLHKLFLGYTGYDEISAGGPNLYVGPLLPLLAALVLLNRRTPWRERGAALFLLFVFYLSITLVLPNTFWHLGTETHLFSFRYSFCCSFVLLILGERSWQQKEETSLRSVLPVALVTAALEVATMILIPREVGNLQAGLDVLLFTLTTLAFCLGTAKRRKTLFLACGVLQTLAVAMVLRANYSDHAEHLSLRQPELNAVLAEGSETLAAVRQLDTGTFRTRNDGDWLSKNDPMLLGFLGSSHFSSSEKRANTDFMESIGVHTFQSRWADGNDGQSRAADALLGVRYLFAPNLDYPEAAEGIYENPYDLSLAMLVSAEVTEFGLPDGTAAENLNAIFASMGAEQPVFSEVSVEERTEQNGSLLLKFRASGNDPVYLQLQRSLPERVTVLVNGTQTAAIGDNNGQLGIAFYPNQLVLLGSFVPGDQVEIRISAYGPELFSEAALYEESSAALRAMKEKTASCPVEMQLLRDDHVVLHADVETAGACLLLSIPFDRAWNITVDGVKTEAAAAFGDLLAIPVQPGAHTVEMRYWPSGLTAGILLTGVTVLLVTADAIRRRKKAAAVGGNL